MASCICRERCGKVGSGQVSQEPREPLEGIQAECHRLDVHGGSLEEALTSTRFCFLAGCQVRGGNF